MQVVPRAAAYRFRFPGRSGSRRNRMAWPGVAHEPEISATPLRSGRTGNPDPRLYAARGPGGPDRPVDRSAGAERSADDRAARQSQRAPALGGDHAGERYPRSHAGQPSEALDGSVTTSPSRIPPRLPPVRQTACQPRWPMPTCSSGAPMSNVCRAGRGRSTSPAVWLRSVSSGWMTARGRPVPRSLR